jgi:hypothetical protein
MDVFGTGITTPGRADVSQAPAGLCRVQLCAVFGSTRIVLSELTAFRERWSVTTCNIVWRDWTAGTETKNAGSSLTDTKTVYQCSLLATTYVSSNSNCSNRTVTYAQEDEAHGAATYLLDVLDVSDFTWKSKHVIIRFRCHLLDMPWLCCLHWKPCHKQRVSARKMICLQNLMLLTLRLCAWMDLRTN